MKLKEKINKKIEENEALSFMKGLWDNKRTRALFWLIIYFIFFFVIISSIRNSYQNQPVNPDSTVKQPLNVSEILEKIDNYSYEILLNGEQNLIVGNVEDNTNKFIYKEKNYIIVGDNVYLEDKLNLTQVDLTKEKDLFIPINKIMLDDIEKYIKEITPVKNEENIEYSLNVSNIFEGEENNFIISFYGSTNIEKIELDFTDYVKSKNEEYEKYVLTIKLGDNSNEPNVG